MLITLNISTPLIENSYLFNLYTGTAYASEYSKNNSLIAWCVAGTDIIDHRNLILIQ
jgi:hypothetical protein